MDIQNSVSFYIDVEVEEGLDKSEIFIAFKTSDGSDLQPQQLLDAFTEILLERWGYIPHRNRTTLDS